jgi:hypothetical protein
MVVVAWFAWCGHWYRPGSPGTLVPTGTSDAGANLAFLICFAGNYFIYYGFLISVLVKERSGFVGLAIEFLVSDLVG